MTETYVAAKLLIDNWRWAEVPFYIRTGKRLRRNLTEIAIAFKQSPHLLFRRKMNGGCAYNTLVLQIQPQESIVLTFEAKIPGQDRALKSVDMHFHYEEAFGGIDADPYARLIRDCMNGDATLFMRKDSIEVAWWLMDSILQYWRSDSALSPASYSAGTLGPEEASFLLDRDGRRWRGL
jgi:glucose-6-phosphate 1-dehydrogenase